MHLGKVLSTLIQAHLVDSAGAGLVDVQIEFGAHLRKVRTKKGVSQERLAELAGLHRTYVSSVERGERNISLVNIYKLAAALEVTLRDLMPKIA